jgi:carbonic anhydrase
MIPADLALARLREGNRRYVAGDAGRALLESRARWQELAARQRPFAVVLGCADSRVPVEIVFDQGLGDLFVIRVAGNVVAPSQIGSVEFAAEQFGTKLVVVLGHSHCGAVAATLAELKRPTASRSPNLSDIVERIEPAVTDLLASDLRDDQEALAAAAVRANVRHAAAELRRGSPIIERLVTTDELRIVGAEYALATGVVDFFDGVALDGRRSGEAP